MKYLKIILIILLISCNAHVVEYDKNDEPIHGKNMQYNISEKPNFEDLKKIDTTAYYVQIFEGRYYNDGEISNPMVLEFHNDGYFKESSIKYYERFSYRTKETIWYGGKYKIYDNNIELESFAPSRGSKTKVYARLIIKGRFDGNKIIFDDKKNNTLVSVYQKKQKLE
jgi:hypothetical protein